MYGLYHRFFFYRQIWEYIILLVFRSTSRSAYTYLTRVSGLILFFYSHRNNNIVFTNRAMTELRKTLSSLPSVRLTTTVEYLYLPSVFLRVGGPNAYSIYSSTDRGLADVAELFSHMRVHTRRPLCVCSGA